VTVLKLAGLIAGLFWATYVTWEVVRAASLAEQACTYAAEAFLLASPGPGLDNEHRKARGVCN
jgi:hypothetical protein